MHTSFCWVVESPPPHYPTTLGHLFTCFSTLSQTVILQIPNLTIKYKTENTDDEVKASFFQRCPRFVIDWSFEVNDWLTIVSIKTWYLQDRMFVSVVYIMLWNILHYFSVNSINIDLHLKAFQIYYYPLGSSRAVNPPAFGGSLTPPRSFSRRPKKLVVGDSRHHAFLSLSRQRCRISRFM